jgi:hypothetical protein
MNQQLPLAVYYEHPEWFRPLFAEMGRRSIQYLRIDAGCHVYDATATDRKYALFFNRMSASAYLRGNAQGIFFTLEISKAAQLALLHSLGLATPRSRIVNCAIQAVPAAQEIGFPVIIPNIGGRGAGIMRFDSAPALERAAAAGEIDLWGSIAPLSFKSFSTLGADTLRASRLRAENSFTRSKVFAEKRQEKR